MKNPHVLFLKHLISIVILAQAGIHLCAKHIYLSLKWIPTLRAFALQNTCLNRNVGMTV
jgi:hypothetical protein